MDSLIHRIRDHFGQLEDRLICFGRQSVQVEGWFKGELLTLFSKLRDTHQIDGFDREVKTGIGRQKIDLQVSFGGQTHSIELKHWRIGTQHGEHYKAHYYFKDASSIGNDVSKLIQFNQQEDHCRWMLILVTPNPNPKSWEVGLEKYRQKYPSHDLVPHTSPQDYPETFFLGLICVKAQ